MRNKIIIGAILLAATFSCVSCHKYVVQSRFSNTGKIIKVLEETDGKSRPDWTFEVCDATPNGEANCKESNIVLGTGGAD